MATLTYVYSDPTAVVGPLATDREPHTWDLCLGHATRITAPRGWELVRHAAPLPTNPDEDDLVAGSYTLQVSSPGLERRLRRAQHYRKSVGRDVKVKTSAPVGGNTTHRGVLGEVDDAGFVVMVGETPLRIGFGEVESARTVFTWKTGAKPGKRR